ncbi:Hypothetical predicted protein [Mytilus galloprovincialis]|uniref:Uncharacterized protein n=1 Tax=Mytilus galloprovincialis TaxID=29158 RepID=A0A8B6EUT1_MYTGA|nr:Hypothetical predicted protein [Mytilus galloprovincialis]
MLTKPKKNYETQCSYEKDMNCVQTTDTPVTDSSTLPQQMDKMRIIQRADESKQEEPTDIADVSKLDHYMVRDDILEEVRKGHYIIDIAPSDLVDFGGQRSYDMTHQLFVQHRGSFIIMFNGKYDLKVPLKEYPQGDVTSESIIMHWINSILTYCPEGNDIMPMVLFAATHSDCFSPVCIFHYNCV